MFGRSIYTNLFILKIKAFCIKYNFQAFLKFNFKFTLKGAIFIIGLTFLL